MPLLLQVFNKETNNNYSGKRYDRIINKVNGYEFQKRKMSNYKNYAYLELLLLILGEELGRGADDLKDWPPILPPVLAADASSTTDPSVNTPAATAIIANFPNLFFSFFFLLTNQKLLRTQQQHTVMKLKQ